MKKLIKKIAKKSLNDLPAFYILRFIFSNLNFIIFLIFLILNIWLYNILPYDCSCDNTKPHIETPGYISFLEIFNIFLSIGIGICGIIQVVYFLSDNNEYDEPPFLTHLNIRKFLIK